MPRVTRSSAKAASTAASSSSPPSSSPPFNSAEVDNDDVIAPAIPADGDDTGDVEKPDVIDLTDGDNSQGVIDPTNEASSSSRGEILLLVFIHGFKGSAETTFLDFPSRLAHLLRETHTGLNVIPIIYPTYDTRGSLATAVSNFVEWLTMQTLQLESKPGEDGRGQGRGTVKIALCGHSMGGLVAVDAALKIADENAMMGEKDAETGRVGELWPRVVSVIAYDSPYYGVHPNVFKNQATKYFSYAQQARGVGSHFAPMAAGLAAAWGMNRNNSNRTNQQSANGGGWGKLAGLVGGSGASSSTSASKSAKSSSGWSSALWATGALATAAAAGGVAAYYKREEIGGAYGYLTEHFEYVSNLWDDKGLRQRLDALIDLPSILFHAYYNRLPAQTSSSSFMQDPRPRTFTILPPLSSHAARLFTPLDNHVSPDEISAHIGMFSGKPTDNDTFLEMGRRSADVLGEVVRSFQTTGGIEGDMNAGQSRMQEQERPVGDAGEEDGLRSGDAGLEGEEEEIKRGWREARSASVDGSGD